MPVKTFPGLTGNQLKLLAMLTMTIDHIGFILLPQYPVLRIIGRLSMPIYAFMVAEGCRYTKNRTKYLLSMAALALLCQVVSFAATGTLYQCILVTFSLSILLIYLLDNALRRQSVPAAAAAAAGFAAAFFLCQILPRLLPGTDFRVDYDFVGVLLPLFPYLGKTRWQKTGFMAAGLAMLCLFHGGIQWYAMAAIPLLALYGGKRGKASMKYLFYIYYPLHMAILYGIAMFL